MYRVKETLVGGKRFFVGAWSPNETERYGIENWSLEPIQEQKDLHTQYRLAAGLCIAFHRMGAYKVYAPNVVPASAQIVENNTLKPIKLWKNVILYRNKDVPADGVFLKENETFGMSGAGCPLGIATDGNLVIVFHAGRDSLIDRGAVIGEPTRKNVSVVNTVVEEFEKRGVPAGKIAMSMQFAIPTMMFDHRFNHSIYGEFNRALAAFVDKRWPGGVIWQNGVGVFLDLEKIFLKQAYQAGIHSRRVWTENSLNELTALTHTRDGSDPNRTLKPRNLYAIKYIP